MATPWEVMQEFVEVDSEDSNVTVVLVPTVTEVKTTVTVEDSKNVVED